MDTSLYSRQLYTIGKHAMDSLRNSKILISGLSGIGIEIAKNLILYGVKQVTIHDSDKITKNDLSSNYYVQSDDIGKYRVDIVLDKLKELNNYVEVISDKNLLSDNLVKSHDLIIITDKFIQPCDYYNLLCRKYNKKFIFANTIGVMGSIFCDFGNEFIIYDQDGEEPINGIITEINDNVFTVAEPHQLYMNDTIEYELNWNGNIYESSGKVSKIINQLKFKIDDEEIPDKIFTKSHFKQIKESISISFDPIHISKYNPVFSQIITSDFERQNLLHCFNMGLYIFTKQFGRMPKSHNKSDANHLIDFVRQEMLTIYKCELTDLQKDIIRKLSYVSRGKLCPIDSVIGSIVAQEAIKGVTGKYTPINQWLYLDFIDILPQNILVNPKYDKIISNESIRYSGLIKIFGTEFQEKLKESNIFIVGAGAIGCELSKNLAMMGINFTITDMDRIEKSNLNRQFLFRNSDIGKFKSEALKESINKINKDIKIISNINKVGLDTLSIYNHEFFNKISCVMTALDNIDARLFVDKLCVNNTKALIDSGTLGTKGNVQCVIPYITESYGESKDPVEKTIPLCTLKNFPYLIDHCIQWARDLFEGYFVRIPQNYINFTNNFDKIKSMTPAELKEIHDDVMFLIDNSVCHSKECIKFAYNLWHLHFRDHLEHLIEKYPSTHLTEEGLDFWSGTRQFPKIQIFDMTNELCINFIESTANLWADVFGLEHVKIKDIITYLKIAKIPKLTESHDSKESTDRLIKKLNDYKDIIFDVKILEFEKDDDTNFHIDFVTSMSNLRADNYNINKVDKFETKKIAGKIIPAIVTTTSLVSGFACLQLLKVLQDMNKIENYNNLYTNLALPFMALSEPKEVTHYNIGKYKHNIWKKMISFNMLLKDLCSQIIEIIDDKDIVSIDSITYDKYTLYDSTNSKHTEKMNMYIYDILKIVTTDIPKTINLAIFLDSDVIIEPIYCNIIF